MRFLKKIIGFYQRKDKNTKISSLNGAVIIKTQNVSDKYISHKRLRLNAVTHGYAFKSSDKIVRGDLKIICN